jgi:3-oxoacyl-[acyl-carrier-protein] synthase-3
VSALDTTTAEVLAQAGRSVESVDWLILHQANIRIMQTAAKKLKLPMERVLVTVDRHGNTSAASIPLALDCGVREGRIHRGQSLLLEGMGGGFTWGGVLIDY